ncbi:MAG: glycosyltransferase [Alphaproteobacteria bacterium]|nr:glycosyltransferase [Alphaproteobacteria bacterium]
MRVSGFTFVRNAVRLEYPVVECIRSVLPIVDEFVVNPGDSDDGTEELISGIDDPKIRIVHCRWNPNVREGGYVLAQQTNVALFNCTGDWAISIQSDEAIHERDHQRLRELMEMYRDDERVEGLVLRRLSFYGDYETVMDTGPMHLDLSCRVVKPHKFVLSRGDAASFTVHPKYKERGRRIRVVDTGLDIFHYMDVRAPASSLDTVAEKTQFWRFARPDPSSVDAARYFYTRVPRCFVTAYTGTHPATMRAKIAAFSGKLDLDSPLWRTKLSTREQRHYLGTLLAKRFGVRFASGRTSRKLIASHRTRD